jgi:FAD/FMN-containing dehydrogenase
VPLVASPFIGSQGAACDKLKSARIVTVEGQILTASNNENEDLFWPTRGGGGNFGIITELEFYTFQKPELVAGVIVYDAKLLKEFLSFFGTLWLMHRMKLQSK